MSRMKVLAVLAVVLAVGAAYAQQTMQPGQQKAAPAWNSPQAVQNLSQAVEKADADLDKAIETAVNQAKGKAIGAAFTLHGPSTGASAGQSSGGQSMTGQGQNLVAHVYVVADSQLKDVIVDAKANKVLNVETRQMVSQPWASRESGMSTGGSAGAGEGGAMEKQGGTEGQTLRERDVSLLRVETAQKIVKYADQDNITLKKAYDTAEQQAKGAKIVGLFLVLPQQANMGAQQSTSGQQENVFAKVMALADNQVKVMTIDVKNDKVLNSETRSTFFSPWEGRSGSSGTGGSSGQGTSGQRGGQSGADSPAGSSGGTEGGSPTGE